jgi:hypothetical protein
MASKPLPPSDRAARLAGLAAESDELRRLEEHLVQKSLDNGEEVTRDPQAPCWAILGVKVAKRARRKAFGGLPMRQMRSKGRSTPRYRRSHLILCPYGWWERRSVPPSVPGCSPFYDRHGRTSR